MLWHSWPSPCVKGSPSVRGEDQLLRQVFRSGARVLDTQNDAEFVAAVAIRTAAFMDEGMLTGPGSRAAFDHKVRHVPNFRQ
jgi:hypothetical protein